MNFRSLALTIMVLCTAQFSMALASHPIGTWSGPAKTKRYTYLDGSVQTVKSTLTIVINGDNTYTLTDSDTGEVSGTAVIFGNQGTISYNSGYNMIVTLHFSKNAQVLKGTLTSAATDTSGFFQEGKFSLKKQSM